jgi:hypothetical protein
MGAGVQRWWRRTFQEEVARHESTLPIVHHVMDPRLTNAITEDGIEIRVRLYTTKPMWYGTFYIA